MSFIAKADLPNGNFTLGRSRPYALCPGGRKLLFSSTQSEPISKDKDGVDVDKAMRYAFVGQTVGIVLSMLLTRTAFGPLFLKHLGASDSTAMWVFGVPGLLFAIQIPLSLAVHQKFAKSFLIGGWTAFGLLVAAAAASPWFVNNQDLRLEVVVALIFLSQIANAAASAFWFPLLDDIVPSKKRGRFFGSLRASWSALLYLCVAASGWFLGPSPSTLRFQLVLMFGAGLVLIRNVLIAKVPDINTSAADDDSHSDLKSHLRYLVKTPAVKRFLVYFSLLGIASGFLGQPFVIYLKDLGFRPGDNMLLFGFTTLGTVLSLLIGGRVVDKWGTFKVFVTVHVATCIVLVLAAFAALLPSKAAVIAFSAIFIASGATVSLAGLACTAYLFCFVPKKGRVFYLTIANFMLTVGPSVAMLITSSVLKIVGDNRTVPLGSLRINVFSWMLLLACVAALLAAPMLKKINAFDAEEKRDLPLQ
jgi:MFS family permease